MATKKLSKERVVVEKALALLESKAHDYNEGVSREDYFPWGMISYHQMLHTKVMRIQSIIRNKDTPNHEGLRDSLEDLLNYTIMALVSYDAD
jgi:hypothetical protein